MTASKRSENLNSYDSEVFSLRQQVFHELDKNPLLTPKNLCKIMDLDYAKYRQYIYKMTGYSFPGMDFDWHMCKPDFESARQ